VRSNNKNNNHYSALIASGPSLTASEHSQLIALICARQRFPYYASNRNREIINTVLAVHNITIFSTSNVLVNHHTQHARTHTHIQSAVGRPSELCKQPTPRKSLICSVAATVRWRKQWAQHHVCSKNACRKFMVAFCSENGRHIFSQLKMVTYMLPPLFPHGVSFYSLTFIKRHC
jgi:hypothetical protein